jgi:membrane protein
VKAATSSSINRTNFNSTNNTAPNIKPGSRAVEQPKRPAERVGIPAEAQTGKVDLRLEITAPAAVRPPAFLAGLRIPTVPLRTIWELFREGISGWNRINAPRLGAALAFYSMLSMAPLVVICVSIAGLVFGAETAESRVAEQIQDLVGPTGAEAIRSVLTHPGSASGVVAGIVGLGTLLFGASGVLVELQDSLNLVWGVKSPFTGLRGLVQSRFLSFAMILGIGFLLLVSLLMSAAIAAAGKFFGQFLPAPEVLLHLASIALSFVVITVLFALLYKIVPDTQIEWRDVWVGAAVTSALFSAGKFLIGFYIGKSGVGSAYGAAASLVVFLVWIYYSAQIFFLGAEFTQVYADRRGSRSPYESRHRRAATAAPSQSEPRL